MKNIFVSLIDCYGGVISYYIQPKKLTNKLNTEVNNVKFHDINFKIHSIILLTMKKTSQNGINVTFKLQ